VFEDVESSTRHHTISKRTVSESTALAFVAGSCHHNAHRSGLLSSQRTSHSITKNLHNNGTLASRLDTMALVSKMYCDAIIEARTTANNQHHPIWRHLIMLDHKSYISKHMNLLTPLMRYSTMQSGLCVNGTHSCTGCTRS
jgi:hypothetical protein